MTLLGVSVFLFASCQKAPELTLTGPTSIELSADGSSGAITFTANRDWTASTSDSWVSLSPSSGPASDGPVTVNVRYDANTTYDDRTATVTISMEGLSQSIIIKQSANHGFLILVDSVELKPQAQTIEIEIQSNIHYTVVVTGGWIKQNSTKGLTTDRLTFSVEENKTYDAREGKITIIPHDGSIEKREISIKQSAVEMLEILNTNYNVSAFGSTCEVPIQANVEYDIVFDVDWIHYTQTKGITNQNVIIEVDSNETAEARTHSISFVSKSGETTKSIIIRQPRKLSAEAIDLGIIYTRDDCVIFSFDKNETGNLRKGTVKITLKNGQFSRTLTFYQQRQYTYVAE